MEKQQSSRFEVFISYRRKNGAQTARTLYYALKSIGIRAFFDYNSIRSGKFNEAIYDAINQADCFILLLTPGALDNCVQHEGDWVRKEIEYAITRGKVIIPVSPTNQGVTSALPPALPPLMEDALRNLQISRLDTEDLFVESLYKIISDRFPNDLCDRHANLFSEIYPERLSKRDDCPDEHDTKAGNAQDGNAVFRYRLLDAIESFKVSIFEYLVKDFLADLNAGGIIKVRRQSQAFDRLQKLLGESECYLDPEAYSRVYTFCDTHLAGTYNEFFEYIRRLKNAGKNTTVSDLVRFISSRMDDEFYMQYNHIKKILAGAPED